MPTEAKRETIDDLRAQLDSSRAMIVSEYRGLKVKEISEIRRTLRKSDVSYRVVKNRLMRIAAQDNAAAEALSPLLVGPTAIAFGQDEAGTAKAVLDATRPYKIVKITGGVLGSRAIDADSVTRLAALPSRDVLLAEAVGAIVAPLSTTAGLFDAPHAGRRRACRGADRPARRRGRSLTFISRPHRAPRGAHHQENQNPWPR